jgi:pimeloyl-ACP methyl ester carboxylesterase
LKDQIPRFQIREHLVVTGRHTTFYLSCGSPRATPIIFVHGWPEQSWSWRSQLPTFAALGFHAIAPDMRGYGRSSAPLRHEDYALEHSVADMLELLKALRAERAIWVAHDWGASVVWSLAQHHPERCLGVASLCVPYVPEGFAAEHIIPLSDRTVYPEDQYPAAQWDYQLFYRENFARAQAGFEANIRNTVRALFRAGKASGKGRPSNTALTRANGGWFGPVNVARDVPRDASLLSADDENRYVEALQRNGFFGPDSWYMNGPANTAYAERARKNWRLEMPALFLHAAHDYVCETVDSRLAEPMRAHCANLTEVVVQSGHWMAQEKPAEVNAALSRWLSAQGLKP